MSNLINRKLQQASQRLASGDLAGADFLCQQVLTQAPRNPEALWLSGMNRLMSGRPAEGVPFFERALAAVPDHGPTLENLGLAYLMLDRHFEAEPVLRRAASLPGAPPSVAMRHGIALLGLGRLQEAVAQLEQSLRQNPGDRDALLNLGRARAQLGQHETAMQAFDTVLAKSPANTDALFNKGVVELELGHHDRARIWFERVIAVSPDHVDALINLAITLRGLDDAEAALAIINRAVRLAPGSAAAADNLGQCLLAANRHGEARLAFLRALQADPGRLSAREGLVAACFKLTRYPEAALHLEYLLDREPANGAACAALANAQFQLGQLDAAQSSALRALTLPDAGHTPHEILAEIAVVRGQLDVVIQTLSDGYDKTGDLPLLGKLSHQLRRACNWPRWEQTWARLSPHLPTSLDVGSPFALLSEPTSAQEQMDYASRWAVARFPSAPRPTPAPFTAGQRRLRVGYLSSDYYEHATAYLLAEVLELHDRDIFEIFAYSYGPDDQSPMRSRLQAACEHFVDIALDPDDVAVARIRDDALDILVDLKGYTMGSRTALLAARPCAIQASWIGYPGTMGADFIDYLIADAFIVPEPLEACYAERIVRLPDCYQPNDRRRPVAPALGRTAYGLPDAAVVLCCFNQSYKITPGIFAAWMAALRSRADAVLWLLDEHPLTRDNLRSAALNSGVDPARLHFAPRVPLAEHLARYRVADLALDTFPYTSHTTASDALWAGCPLLALCGDTFASRVSGSILTAAGVPELIAEDLESYERELHRLILRRELLAEFRQKLVGTREKSPLFDTPRFTRDLEQVLIQIASEKS